MRDRWKEASMPQTSSIRPVVSIQYWLVIVGETDRRTDGRTDERTHDDSKYVASRGKKSNAWDSHHLTRHDATRLDRRVASGRVGRCELSTMRSLISLQQVCVQPRQHGCHQGAARICCWAPCCSVRHSAANPPHAAAEVEWWNDRRTDGRTPDRYIDPAPHTMWAVPITAVICKL